MGGAISKISKEFKDNLESIGVKSPGNIDYLKMEKNILELVKKWKAFHSLMYGPDYWKELIKQLSSEEV